MSIGSFVVSLSVFLIDNVFSVCFTCILRWFSAQIKYYYYYYYYYQGITNLRVSNFDQTYQLEMLKTLTKTTRVEISTII